MRPGSGCPLPRSGMGASHRRGRPASLWRPARESRFVSRIEWLSLLWRPPLQGGWDEGQRSAKFGRRSGTMGQAVRRFVRRGSNAVRGSFEPTQNDITQKLKDDRYAVTEAPGAL